MHTTMVINCVNTRQSIFLKIQLISYRLKNCEKIKQTNLRFQYAFLTLYNYMNIMEFITQKSLNFMKY